ncbi:hypothetical protein RSK20926_06982 [Roseobacter sp. SK209-2-6]|uniref:hypothetical protein n=1 Tax=Roseobacter sp. SK209-2-6 TaxID=388739 RepID=UPI0000F3D852|nr:hypothetical protein [Roseobacter sp. SK209-2-6]EBA17461.1 hypothetical protein RSK20926_06982 [Roseobacter sp. SK209-2-6]
MFSELEHSCLLKLALECKHKGLSQSESLDSINTRMHGICSPFRISQAVDTAFHPERCPDLI